MTDFIPHYFTVIDPVALLLIGVGMVFLIIGWMISTINDTMNKR